MAESSNIEFKLFWVQIHGPEVLDEHVNAVFTLSSRGHFIPAEVEVKATRKLLACASVLSFDLMDVEWLQGHWPTRQEVELREVLSEQVGVFCVDVVAPLNRASSFLDDADGIVVFHTGEGQFRNDHLDRFLALSLSVLVDDGDERLRFFFFGDGLPDVMNHAFKHTHHVVVVGP